MVGRRKIYILQTTSQTSLHSSSVNVGFTKVLSVDYHCHENHDRSRRTVCQKM